MSGLLIGLISGIHVLVCIALTITILLQSGKGGGLAGAFGGGSSQTLFGGRGAATFLSRSTTVLAVVFFLTSLTLGLASSHTGAAGGKKSLIREEAQKRAEQRAATQGATGAPSAGTEPGAGAPSNAPPTGTTPPPATQNGATAPTGGSK